MKLKRDGDGYEGSVVIDGYIARIEITPLIEKRGWSFTWYVNDRYMLGDGWYGLRLKDIKMGLDNDAKQFVEDYKANKEYRSGGNLIDFKYTIGGL